MTARDSQMVFVPSGALCYALVHDPGRGGRWLVRSGLWSGGDPTAEQGYLVPRPGPVAGHAALTRLIKDRVLVNEHLAMRSEAGHLQRRGPALVTKQRADVALEPQAQPTRP